MCKKNDAFAFSLGIIAGVIGGIIGGVLYAPKSGEESRKDIKDAACELYEKHAPQIVDAKKQALESVDLMKYKLERQMRKLTNSLKSNKMRKAKALEDSESSNNESEFDY